MQSVIQLIKQQIEPHLKQLPDITQQLVDQSLIKLDAINNKQYLGANTMLAVSLATARAIAKHNNSCLFESLGEYNSNYILPVPMMNILNGGVHANNNLDIQEFMIMPLSPTTFKEALRYGVEVFWALKSILKHKGVSTAVGDEGGFAPDLGSNQATIELLLEAIELSGLAVGKDIYLALDIASTELFKAGKYYLHAEKKILTAAEFIEYQLNLVNQYPILSIEDGLAEDDWSNWQQYTHCSFDKK